ncbi:MAG TPA: efflux RND transporter periplasmic adaptor subunit [Burkholderiaceae bacterium]|nr:efflux RND transporter periplasmic adaptor subunit [Burkholderiaceae bacterium]
MRKNLLLAGIGAAVAAAAVMAAHPWTRTGNAPVAMAARQPVEVATVEMRDVADVYAADAVIEAVHAATVSAQIAGNVTQYYVDAGDRVKRGQVLVRIDTRETDAQVAAGAANVAQAEAQLAQTKINYERTAKLVESRFVSQSALDKADADLKSAQATLQMARAGATQATTARSFAEVRSPVDGVVTRRLAELGELASPGKPLIEVHDPSALRAVASVPQFVLPRIATARQAEVVLPTLELNVVATHVTVLPAADARLLSTQVRADLPAGIPATVVPGTAAKVMLPTGSVKRLVIPAEAVVRRGELTATYVVGADGQARLRQIRVGETAGAGWLEVLAGVDAGERVQIVKTVAAR